MKEVVQLLVEKHKPFDARESSHHQATMEFLSTHDNCFSRSNLSGHVTASAWVLSDCRTQALLTHHRQLNRWLQPGGHIENDSSIQAAAIREASEESGIDSIHLLSEDVFDIDVHQIPEKKGVPAHLHYDLRFLMMASHQNFRVSAESHDLAWRPLETLRQTIQDDSILRMVSKSLDFVADDQNPMLP